MKEVRAKKKFGQNFLIDKNVIANIISEGNISSDSLVIEIGPGTGALTEHLVKAAGKVMAFEIDTDLIPILHNKIKTDNFVLINKDILEVDVAKEIKENIGSLSNVIIIGNLPYYITTPIILGLLEKNIEASAYVFMVQREVADRLTAKPKTKDYNALSVLMNYKTKTKKCFDVSPQCFSPVPGVWSSVIKLTPFEYEIFPHNEKLFYEVNRAIFKQRRKTLLNNLQAYGVSKENALAIFAKLGFKPTIRSEELGIAEIIKLSDEIEAL